MLKQILSVVALVAVSQAALAKTKNEIKVDKCVDRIENECRGSISVKAVFKREGRTECKQVAGDNYENSRQEYLQKVILTDSNSIISVRIPKNSAQCDVTRFEVAQGFSDETVFGGRMITVAGNGKIYIVARNNEIHELFDNNDRSYNDVTAVKVDQANDRMTVTQRGGKTFVLKLSTVTTRLNNKQGSKCIQGCSGKIVW